MAGLEPSYIGRIERGRENTTIETLEALGAILQAPLSAFFILPAEGEARPGSLKPGRKRKDRLPPTPVPE